MQEIINYMNSGEMFYNLSSQTLAILFAVAIIAGFVDTIAGGGGLLVTPALLLAGIPPHLALATSKLQSTGGSGFATLYFIRKGMIDPKECKLMILCTFIGAVLGGWLLFYANVEFLKILIPFMLIAVGFYFLVKPDLGALERERRLSPLLFALLPALLIGFYDGFFGPGTGTFFALAFVTLAGYQITKATAHAKLLNFISNISALLYFAIFKELIWEIGILMFIGQVIGANFGARLVIGKGTTIIRPILVVVCFSIASKLIYDYFSSFSG